MLLKRLFDICLSVFLLVSVSPVFIVIAMLIILNLGPPIIFRQKRPGIKGQPFQMVKFRTMRNLFDLERNLLPDSERMTLFGSFLRSSSLDELPELWNVLNGEMSLVGPRPLLMEYLPLYSTEQFRRHEVRPGITGWAQVNGRNELSWNERFEMDVWYVDNRTFWLDLKILCLTFKKVIQRDGISAEGEVTMSKFNGNQP